MTKSASSQDVNVEIIGADTFPMAIVYHGVPVAIFTDSQMTTIAQTFESNNFYATEVQYLVETQGQLQSIIKQKNIQIDTIQAQLALCTKAEIFLKKNEADYIQNEIDWSKKYNALKRKSNMRIGLGAMGSLLVGGGVGLIIGLIVK